MTQEEFHEMLADLLGVETWDSQKVVLFEKEIGMLFKKVTNLDLLGNVFFFIFEINIRSPKSQGGGTPI